MNSDFRKKYSNEKIYFKVKLIKFYVIRNLYDNSQIQKKILVPSKIRKNFYATDGDIVTYNMQCFYKQKEIYNKEQSNSLFTCSLLYISFNKAIPELWSFILLISNSLNLSIFFLA